MTAAGSSAANMSETIQVHIEFGGGTELLTAPPHTKKHTITLPRHVSSNSLSNTSSHPAPTITSPDTQNEASEGASSSTTTRTGANSSSANETDSRPVDVRFLIQWLKQNLIVERPELFVDGENVRPGILVLINNADWELEGELEYALEDGDEVVFISTLHGG